MTESQKHDDEQMKPDTKNAFCITPFIQNSKTGKTKLVCLRIPTKDVKVYGKSQKWLP